MFSRFLSSLSISLLFLPYIVWGSMSGSVYSVVNDSLDVAGGRAAGSIYAAADTVTDIAPGRAKSSNYAAAGGFNPTFESSIALATNQIVLMDTPIGGLSGGESNGASVVTVVADGIAGYTLTVQATSSPAMRSDTALLSNYSTIAPEYMFMTGATDAHFGFSVHGSDVTDQFRTDGSACGAGSAVRGYCWQGLPTEPVVVAEGSGNNAPFGAETEVLYRVGIGNQTVQAAGDYVATTIITALPR